MTQDRTFLGIALMLGFCLTAPMIDVASKIASQAVPVGQVTAARFVVQAALMVPVVILMRVEWRMSRRVLGLTFLRAAVSILATYAFIAAVQVMPLADALAIAFVEPFIILLLGWALFGESVGPRRIAACAVGFAGALLVIRPSFVTFGPVAFFPLMTAVFFALYILITRSLARQQHPAAMQAHTALAACVLTLPVLLMPLDIPGVQLGLAWPQSGTIWLALAGVGAAATVAHMLMTYALRFAGSTTLAPLHYFEMIATVFFGYTIFGDLPDAISWAGIAIITASGLYLVHRERVVQRSAAPTVPAAIPLVEAAPASLAP